MSSLVNFRWDVRLGSRFGYQSVSIFGPDIKTALDRALIEQVTDPQYRLGFSAMDIISIVLKHSPTEAELTAIAEERELEGD